MAVMIAAVAGGVFYAKARDRKRTEALQMAALTMGYSYQEIVGDAELAQLAGELPVCHKGYGRKAQRLMRGKAGDREATVFDYRYTTGSGKSSHVHFQTIVLFQNAGGLPDFELSPENFFHRIGQMFGYQDIDFESNEEFSKRYLLRGKDESAIRAAFGPEILSFFAGNPGWQVQSHGGRLAVFREGKWTPVDDLRAFVADAQRIAGMMAPVRR